MAVAWRKTFVAVVFHDCQIEKKRFLLSVVANVLERVSHQLLDVFRMFVEVLGHDDEGQHVGQRNFLDLEDGFESPKFGLEPPVEQQRLFISLSYFSYGLKN